VVRKAAQEFIAASTANDRSGISNALQDMQVFALCPAPEEHLSRMELVAGHVIGRVRTIPLVELSLFALELEDYGKAIKYATEAHTFDPGSWELYNLSVVEGLVALNARKGREAIQYLDESIRACQRDEYASLSCGIRVPNLALAEKLLQSGHKVEVLRHLLECKDVWQFLRVKIDKWISLIEAGEAPDFGGAGVLRAIPYRLQMQWLRAYSLSLEKEPGVAARKSPAEVMAGRNRLREEYRRRRVPPER
jgi:tetratricopeptide (TPR) repeat protein